MSTNQVAETFLVGVSVGLANVAGLAVIAQANFANDGVFRDVPLMAVCVIGSTLGALLSLSLFPIKATNEASMIRALCGKFFTSMAGGIGFTPIIILRMQWPLTPDIVIGVATATSAIVIALLHKAIPWGERRVTAMLDLVAIKWFGMPKLPDDDESRPS